MTSRLDMGTPTTNPVPAPGHPTLLLTRYRVFAAVLLVLYVALVGTLVFWRVPVDGHGGILDALFGTQLQRYVYPRINYRIVEAGANVVMFLPIGALTILIVGVRRWWLAILLSCGGSALIELIQFCLLPQRYATIEDIATNATGAVLGILLTAGTLGLLSRTRGGNSAAPS